MADAKHPPELKILFFTEMWERFSFYLMLGILPQYLADSQKGGMAWTDEQAAVVVGTYIALVYFTPFIGGLMADRLFGFRKMIIAGGLLMMIGHLVLAIPNEIGLYLGLGFLILGNGGFKPNISSLLGNLYPPGSPLKDSAYSIFYLGVNLGAFICNFVAALARNYFDEHPIHVTSTWQIAGWHAAFATAAVGMLLGLLLFLFNYRRFDQADTVHRAAGSDASLTPLWVECVTPAALFGAAGWFASTWKYLPFNPPTGAFIGACLPVLFFYFNIWRTVPDRAEKGRVAALLVIYAVVIVFWMTFHLNTTALNVWARDDTDREPNAAVAVITNAFPEFAENAPPKYFDNAGPTIPRPAKGTYDVVSDERYKQLETAKQLIVVEDKKVFVTQSMLDKIYSDTDDSTPILEEGKHLKVTNTELFQSINAGFVILFTPLVVGFFSMLRNRGQEPSTAAKIGLGLAINGGAPALMLAATIVSNDGAMKVSAWWLFGVYAIATVGELCLSPMGLALVNKVSPARIQAFMMGGWFLATSFGNKLSGIMGEVYHQWDHNVFWIVLVVCDVAFGLIVLALLPWFKRQMGSSQTT